MKPVPVGKLISNRDQVAADLREAQERLRKARRLLQETNAAYLKKFASGEQSEAEVKLLDEVTEIVNRAKKAVADLKSIVKVYDASIEKKRS